MSEAVQAGASGGEKRMDLILSTRGVNKRFDTVDALTDVAFDLRAGEVRALLGVNGAGKSVFVKILSGLLRKDSGQIFVGGIESEIVNPRDAALSGIASVQQHPELVNELAGYENIYLGHEARGGAEFAIFDRNNLRGRAETLARRVQLNVDVARPLHTMSAIERELIAILQALSSESIRILILDEPTSILTEAEKDVLFGLIRNIKARGVGVIYITHRLDEVFEIADSFTVFRGGRVVATAAVDRAAHGERIAEMMLGTRMGEVYPAKTPQPGDSVLAVEALSYKGAFESVSFAARRGQVLGVFGLRGSGLDELSKVMFGALAPDKGRLLVKGNPVRLRSPKVALRRGIFLVPGDRWSEGLTPSQDVAFNTTLANLSRVSLFGGFLRQRLARKETASLAALVDLQPPDTWRAVSTFSGGNQQKVVIAKGLFREAAVYIFVEPTAGVDIGARAKIYALIRELASRSAVIVMSPDCDEVFGLADEILALYKGRLTLSATTAQVSREEVMLAGLMGQARRHGA